MRISDFRKRLLTFVAQSLQRWAGGVLERQEATPRGERNNALAPTDSTPSSALSDSGNDNNSDASGRGTVELGESPTLIASGGPPAHWVERVRHVAPQLLLPSSMPNESRNRQKTFNASPPQQVNER